MEGPEATTAQIEMQMQMMRQEWERVKRDPSSRLSLSFPGRAQCIMCRQLMENFKVCSACKMAVYCSPQCAKIGWKRHKIHCPALRRDAERIPKYKAVLEQFPWTDVGYNIEGRFNEQFVLLQFGVLGTSRQRVGYWAYHERRDVADEVLDAPWSPLTEDEGWRLPKELIPSLALHDSDTCPAFPPTFETNWTSYYQWRGLPMASPAAILLHWPLAVYACLKELGLLQSATDLRKKLTVFYVGARDEVCFIPVFGELALLIPNTDLDLVMFGENTGRAVQRAKARGITRSPRPCVFEYTAPTACGSGTIRVFIDSNPTYYRPSRDRSEHPDAIVALNAGLGTYISWQHVVLLSSEFDIPFVVTDYAEVCLVDAHLDALQQILTSTFPVPKDAEHIRLQVVLKKVLEEVQIMDVEKVCAALKRERPARLNELMQPGYRGDMSKRIHGARNACIQVITPVAKNVEVRLVEK